MSLKNGKTEKKKPRAMPVETIVTRYKSKQKQLEFDQQNSTSTKVVEKNQKSSKKKVQKAKKAQKHVKKVGEDVKQELYPNKLKRKIVNKKIVLMPKNHFKLIGAIKGCNKRKLCRPRKEISYQKRQRYNSNSSNELKLTQKDVSIIDMVKLMEDSKSLDDEDLLEILTCPSPVWWEDPLDGYIEEAIFSRPQPKFEQKSVKSQILEEQKKEEERIKIASKVDLSSQKVDGEMKMPSININVENRDKTFIKKRSKLETLLGNIKNKAMNTKVSESDTKDNFIQKTKNFKKSKNLKSKTDKNSTKKTNSKKSQNRKNKINSNIQRNVDISKSPQSLSTDSEKAKIDTEVKVESENKTRNSDSFNLSDFEDDVLKNLENIDIPIENMNDTLNINKERKSCRRTSIESNISEKNMTAEYLDMSVFDDDIEAKMDDVPTDVIKTEKNSVESEISERNDKKENFNNNSNSKHVKSEHMTVYRIVDNELNNEVSKLKIVPAKDNAKIGQNVEKSIDNNGKINNYYKQCKKVQLNKNVGELTKVQEKSILISESDAVRYCFICSSIFDKESCDYCAKKDLRKKKMFFSCDICGLKVNTKLEMIKHLEEHRHNIIQ